MNHLSITRFLRITALLAVACIASSASSHAALLVYEGFTGYSAGTLETQKPNANTTGLDKNAGYYDGASPSRAAGFILTTGLSFGSLSTSGGALSYVANPITLNINVIGADISIGTSPFTGTLWTSYLTRITTRGGSSGDGSLLRVGDSPNDTADIRYTSWSDSRTNSADVAVSYATANGNNGAGSLLAATTYIIISRFTGVGTGSGVATLWALNESQFSAFLTAGGDETTLNALSGTSVTATASHTNASGTRTFETGDAFSLVTVNGTGVFDEIRFGSSLADVTPTAIPEPASTATLAGLAALLCFAVRARRA